MIFLGNFIYTVSHFLLFLWLSKRISSLSQFFTQKKTNESTVGREMLFINEVENAS